MLAAEGVNGALYNSTVTFYMRLAAKLIMCQRCRNGEEYSRGLSHIGGIDLHQNIDAGVGVVLHALAVLYSVVTDNL